MPTDHPHLRLLRGDEADVFDAHQLALRCAVRHAVTAPDAVVEDACAFAWLQFLRRQPDRATAFAWLRTVAIRHAWRLTAREQRDVHLEEVPAWEDLRGKDTTGPAVDARQTLRDVAELPARQRRCLTLLVSGHTYDEIAHVTGTTRTNVNKQLTRARTNLRAIR